MKRFPAVLLSLLIALSCLPSPALAAEGVGFSDVDPDAWYAPYIDVCVKAGVMQGVGDERFEPEGELTAEEAIVLLMRFYDLQQSGDGSFDAPPPESWGTARLTYEDGASLLLTAEQMDRVGTHSGSWYTASLSPEDNAVAATHLEQSATLTDLATGTSFPAHTFFQSEWSDDPDLQISGDYLPGFFESRYKGEWYGSVLWYVLEQGFYDSTVNEGVMTLAGFTGYGSTIQRNYFTEALAEVAGELEKINQAPSSYLSRESHEYIYRLYEAGIVTQVNSSGNIDTHRFYSSITRAEAAAMVARVLRPELRVQFSLLKPEA